MRATTYEFEIQNGRRQCLETRDTLDEAKARAQELAKMNKGKKYEVRQVAVGSLSAFLVATFKF